MVSRSENDLHSWWSFHITMLPTGKQVSWHDSLPSVDDAKHLRLKLRQALCCLFQLLFSYCDLLPRLGSLPQDLKIQGTSAHRGFHQPPRSNPHNSWWFKTFIMLHLWEGGGNPGNLRTFIAPRTLYDLYGTDTMHIDLRLGQEVVAREGMHRLPHWNDVRIYPHSTTQHLLGPKVMGRNRGEKNNQPLIFTNNVS